ncbi:MAG: ABC transporter permease [Erysipelotrichaceae bacterium]|nr:ABC transporter permease [Erysipelotrichaceae bacterium]MBR2827539.1 ABC transporter permease [Erysipelotrichaceae bacterium]MBR3351643.1 ABC transporter permease [Erysipelotrichaceae bacterium]MBR6956988.1 ABC transporter permease [Erysipelotrichaceae bacterium]
MSTLSNILFMTIRLSTPIVLAALACSITKKAGLLNMGAEALMLMAALIGVLVSAWTQSLIIGLVAGLASSILITLIICYVSFDLKCDLNLTNISMNNAVIGGTVFIMYLVTGQKSVTAGILNSKTMPTVNIPIIKDIPFIGEVISGHNVMTYIAIVMIVAVWFLLYKTVLGLRIRCVGENPMAAESVGISSKKIWYISYALSGLVAGMGGVFLSMGYLSWFARDMMGGRGFMAMAAMNIANGEPVGSAVNALLFGLAQAFGTFIQRFNINADLILAFPYMFAVLLISVLTFIRQRQEKQHRLNMIKAREQKV